MNQKGFSLVELLVVVAIIGVLAGVGVIGYQQYTESTKTKVLEANFNTIVRAVNFELTVANNGLQTTIKEVNESEQMIDEDGNVTTDPAAQTFVRPDTTCNNFAISVKEHFKKFKNPWKTDWESVTVSTVGQAAHRQGQIQLVCYSFFGNYGNGGGCPIKSSACILIAQAYKKDRGRWNTTDGLCNNEQAGADPAQTPFVTSCLIRERLGGTRRSSNAEAQSDCEWDVNVHGPWYVTQTTINADAGGACGGSSGSPCS